MLQGLEALARDPATRVIVLISKPPAPEVAAARARRGAQRRQAGGGEFPRRRSEDRSRGPIVHAAAHAGGRRARRPSRWREGAEPALPARELPRVRLAALGRSASATCAACTAAAHSATRPPLLLGEALGAGLSNTPVGAATCARERLAQQRPYADRPRRRRLHPRPAASDDRLPPAQRAHRSRRPPIPRPR